MSAPATYPFIPRPCRRGDCNHDIHPRFRSYRCLSGECGCASKGLACGTAGTNKDGSLSSGHEGGQ